jgi:hypothetical protein
MLVITTLFLLIVAPITCGSLHVNISRLFIQLKFSHQNSGFVIVKVHLTLHVLKLRVWTGFLINNDG